MIISRGRNYVFVHIPKTGGTSLALALEGRAMKDDILIGDTPKALKRRRRLKALTPAGRLWKHSTLADIDGVLSPDEIARAFTFTLVRNPWDRLVSYYHWLRGQRFDHPAARLARDLPFSAFLNHDMTRASVAANPYARYMTAADGSEQCRLYIRLEHFETDAQPLWDHLGMRLALPHANRSDRAAGWQSHYSPADADLVARLCAQDVARFGYDVTSLT